MSKESTLKTMFVAFAVCVTASILVASAAVFLRPIQDANRAIDRKKNILIAAGLIKEGDSPSGNEVEQIFEKVEVRIVDLASGNFVEDADTALVESGGLLKDPSQSINLTTEEDIAKIQRMAKLQPVYLVRDGERISRMVLPIRGKGLWSTILGYIALDGDANTVQGITFYSHAETAGLGAEIDNPVWKQKWVGKEIFDLGSEGDVVKNGQPVPVIEVIKGSVDTSEKNSRLSHQIDGISGATLTSRGVMHLVRFWLGPHGFGPMLQQMRK